MLDIEEKAIQIYRLNMQYIEKKHYKLYRDLLSLDSEIEKGHYKEHYELEYIEDRFDIKRVDTGQYIYNKNSIQISQSYADNTSWDKDKSTIEAFPLFNLSVNSMNEHGIRARKHIYPLMQYSLEHTKNDTKMKDIVKFIFSGVGLGIHIEMIDQKINAARYLIIEDDIELFKLSLFVTKYYEISKNSTIYFSVLDDTHTFRYTYIKFLEDAYIYNYKLKYSHLSSHSNSKLKEIISLTSSLTFAVYPYQLQIDNFLSPLKYLNKGYPLLDMYINIDTAVFKDKPILVIASGPSLSKNIEWLKEHHTKFIILAVSSSLKYLYQNNIKPDIVVTADQQEIVKDFFKPYIKNNFFKNTLLLFSSITHECVIASLDKENVFIADVSLQYNSENQNFSFSCVGSFAYLYALSLNAQNTYILGLDLAVDQETGADHISEHIKSSTLDMKNKVDLPSFISLTKSLIPIEGNFKETIYTTPSFHSSIYTINKYANNLKKQKQHVYNLNHGAKIAAAEALELVNIDVENMQNLNKSSLFNSLKKILQENSSLELTPTEDNLLTKNRILNQEIKKIIFNYSKKKITKNQDEWIERLIDLSDDIRSHQTLQTRKQTDIYKAYFEYSLNIVYNFFNTQKLSHTKEHITEFNKMIFFGLNEITEQIREGLAHI